MTNEEIVLQIQQGHTELFDDLWSGTHGIIAKLSLRYNTIYRDVCMSNGITVDDLMQSGYLAMVAAVKDFKAEKGFKFSTYLNLHFKNLFMIMAGRKTSKRDMLERCSSLDVPINEDSEITLMDYIEDPTNQISNIDERIYQEQLREAISRMISTLPDDQKNVIIEKYYNNLPFADIGQRLNISRERAKQLEVAALRKMRHGKYTRYLKPFANEIRSHALRCTGLRSFTNMQASSVELTVEWLERKDTRNTIY